MTDIDLNEQAPDQPPGIDQDSHDMPAPAEAAARVLEWVGNWGDGLIDTQGAAKLFSRDLAAIATEVARLTEERDYYANVVKQAQLALSSLDERIDEFSYQELECVLGDDLTDENGAGRIDQILAARDARNKAAGWDTGAAWGAEQMGGSKTQLNLRDNNPYRTPQQGKQGTMLSRIARASEQLSQGTAPQQGEQG